MAVFGFEHGAARRWATLIERVFGLESADAPLPPGFILESQRPEWAFPSRVILFSTGDQSIAAGVGNLGELQLENPSGSDRIVVCLGATVINKATAGRVRLILDSPQATAPSPNIALDTRQPLNAATVRAVASVNRIANNLPAIAGNVIDGMSLAIGETKVFPIFQPAQDQMGVILVPNNRLTVWNLTANEILTACLWGYERPATKDELAQ